MADQTLEAVLYAHKRITELRRAELAEVESLRKAFDIRFPIQEDNAQENDFIRFIEDSLTRCRPQDLKELQSAFLNGINNLWNSAAELDINKLVIFCVKLYRFLEVSLPGIEIPPHDKKRKIALELQSTHRAALNAISRGNMIPDFAPVEKSQVLSASLGTSPSSGTVVVSDGEGNISGSKPDSVSSTTRDQGNLSGRGKNSHSQAPTSGAQLVAGTLGRTPDSTSALSSSLPSDKDSRPISGRHAERPPSASRQKSPLNGKKKLARKPNVAVDTTCFQHFDDAVSGFADAHDRIVAGRNTVTCFFNETAITLNRIAFLMEEERKRANQNPNFPQKEKMRGKTA